MAEQGALAGYLAAVQLRCYAAGQAPANEGDFSALLAEVEALAECISRARYDLTALGADELVDRQVPAATDELDAIVSHTAAATTTILDVCEQLELDVAGQPAQEPVSSATRQIYEACSFQDITGQRVAKVVQTLLTVEARVQAILRAFGHSPAVFEPVAMQPPPLLNGPQRARDAIDQRAVDALLATFE